MGYDAAADDDDDDGAPLLVAITKYRCALSRGSAIAVPAASTTLGVVASAAAAAVLSGQPEMLAADLVPWGSEPFQQGVALRRGPGCEPPAAAQLRAMCCPFSENNSLAHVASKLMEPGQHEPKHSIRTEIQPKPFHSSRQALHPNPKPLAASYKRPSSPALLCSGRPFLAPGSPSRSQQGPEPASWSKVRGVV